MIPNELRELLERHILSIETHLAITLEGALGDSTAELRALLATPPADAADMGGQTGEDQGEVQRLREALEHCSEVMKDPWKHGEGCISRAINRADAALSASTGQGEGEQ